jgi:hypothetical protein
MKTILLLSITVAFAACQTMKHDQSCPPSKQKCAMSDKAKCEQMKGKHGKMDKH